MGVQPEDELREHEARSPIITTSRKSTTFTWWDAAPRLQTPRLERALSKELRIFLLKPSTPSVSRTYIDPGMLSEHNAVLGISGAGVTNSVERSIKIARSAGALTIAVTGAKDNKCALAADEVLMTDALNEGPTVRTISNIFMQLGLYAFATALGEAKGTIDAQRRLYWDAQLDRLISKVP